MRSLCQFFVPGGNTHIIPKHRMESLQQYAAILGAHAYPLLLRAGSLHFLQMQPVTVRAFLAEIEHLTNQLNYLTVFGIRFCDATGKELGSIYSAPEKPKITGDEVALLSVNTEGIRIVVRQFPPPVGFRSGPGMPAGCFECFFTHLHKSKDGWLGFRTDLMGGSGAPIQLQSLPLPPVVQWDVAKVAGNPAIAAVEFTKKPGSEAFKDCFHILDSTCNESLRLHEPLQIQAL